MKQNYLSPIATVMVFNTTEDILTTSGGISLGNFGTDLEDGGSYKDIFK